MKMENWLKGEFGSYLGWLCVDPSNRGFNLMVQVFFGQLVPLFSFFYISCKASDAALSLPFKGIIELSLTMLANYSFFTISNCLLVKCDLFLLDYPDSHFRRRCLQHIKDSLEIRLPCCVLFFFVAKCAYKIWWYAGGASENEYPLLGNMILLSNIVACLLELSSWLYRTTIFFFACIVFSSVHNLQKLRANQFNKDFFKPNSDLKSTLDEYLTIFQDMSSINSCFSPFFGVTLTLITVFQVAAVVVTVTLLQCHPKSTIFLQTDLVMWSMTIVAGLMIMLHSAIEMLVVMKGITSAASRWHATQTINSATGFMSFKERKTLVKCLAQNACGVVINGVKVDEFLLRLINWTTPALTSILTYCLFFGCITKEG